MSVDSNVISAIGAVLAAVIAGIAVWYSHRAYMISRRPQMKAHQFVFEVHEGASVGHCMVTNTGGDKARLLFLDAIVLVLDQPLPQEFPCRPHDGPNVWRRQPNRPPNETHGKMLHRPLDVGEVRRWEFSIKSPLTASDANEISRGARDLYLIGQLQYKSGQGLIYWTHFCRKYDPQTNHYQKIEGDWEGAT